MPRRLFVELWSDRRGVSALVIALGLTALLGFAGLAIDVSLWYADKRAAQGAADSAAFSAAYDYMQSGSSRYATATANAIAAQYGFVNGSGGVTVTVNNPPLSGTHKTSSAFEVIIQKSETLAFTTLFINSASIAARAVASAGSTGGKYCVLVLNSGNITTTDLTGNANIDLAACGMQVDGTGSNALSLNGSASLTAKYVSVVGGISQAGSSTLTVTGTKATGAPSVANPYANVTAASAEAGLPSGAAACPNGGTTSWTGGTVALSPGYFCGGFATSGNATLNLSPGVYVIQGGQMNINGGTTINGTGVTFVLTGSGSNYATATINGGANLNLTAPTTGPTAGLAFFADPNAPTTSVSSFLGGATQSITGALAFPSQQVVYTGNSNTPACTEIVAYDLTFKGDSKLSNNCANTGTTAIGASASQIVE